MSKCNKAVSRFAPFGCNDKEIGILSLCFYRIPNKRVMLINF